MSATSTPRGFMSYFMETEPLICTPSTSHASSSPPLTPTGTASTIGNTETANRAEICPEPGRTFILRTIDTNHVLVLRRGELRLTNGSAEPEKIQGSLWDCVETDGWLGFRNTISGTYIGHNNCHSRDPRYGISYAWRFRCSASKHGDWESFQIRRHRNGGYSLWVKHYKKLLPMVADPLGEDDGVLIDQDGKERISWEFLDVE